MLNPNLPRLDCKKKNAQNGTRMDILLIIIFAMFGAAIGSFLNVCIDRLPAGKSLAYPPSHCDSCQHRLAPKDLIPILSYLWLKGRCRYCRAPISRRQPLVEVISATLFAFIFWRFGLSAQFAITVTYSCIFVIIMFIDLEHKLILNKVTFPAMGAALIILAIDSCLPGAGLLRNLTFIFEPSILSGIIGGALGFVFFLIVYFINPRGMGMGDVKLAGLIGLVTGFPLALVALFIGIVSGGLVAIVLLTFKLKGRKELLPYGFFLAIGPIVTLLWGNEILTWYLGFF